MRGVLARMGARDAAATLPSMRVDRRWHVQNFDLMVESNRSSNDERHGIDAEPPLPGAVGHSSYVPTAGLRNVNANSSDPYSVSWYDFKANGHPTLRFYRWAHRHCYKLPDESREYYRRLLRQETRAGTLINITWEIIVAVGAGYHKASWVLRKYDVGFTPVPAPFDDFWSDDMYEERRSAYNRSALMKEMQALTREDTPQATGSYHNRLTASRSTLTRTDGRGSGDYMHADDLPAPTEDEVKKTQMHVVMNELRGYAPDAKDISMVVQEKRRMRRDIEANEELYGFEDEDEDYKPPTHRKSPVM